MKTIVTFIILVIFLIMLSGSNHVASKPSIDISTQDTSIVEENKKMKKINKDLEQRNKDSKIQQQKMDSILKTL